MSNLTTFQNETLNASVRVVEIDGEPWFVAKDVCEVLGYTNAPAQVARRHCETGQTQVLKRSMVTDSHLSAFPNRGMLAVSEGGLYALVLGSTLPSARAFKLWVTNTVLPAIRKDGAYIMGEEKVATVSSGSTPTRRSGETLRASQINVLQINLTHGMEPLNPSETLGAQPC